MQSLSPLLACALFVHSLSFSLSLFILLLLFVHCLAPLCSLSRFPSFNLSLQPSSFYPLFFLHLSPSLILSPSFSSSLFLAHSPVLVLYLPHSRSRSELSLASETTGILSPSPEISPSSSSSPLYLKWSTTKGTMMHEKSLSFVCLYTLSL